jgi:hypothetical protein
MKKTTEPKEAAQPQQSLEDELVTMFVEFMGKALPYVQANSVHGAYYRNIGLFGAGMFPSRKAEILELLKDNSPVREMSPASGGMAVEGNPVEALKGGPVVVTAEGAVINGVDGEEGCDSCNKSNLIAW